MSQRSFRREGRRRAERRRRRLGGAAALAAAAAVAAPATASADDTITVDTKADSGPGSFRAAVASANSSADHDTIVFASNVTGSITLSTEVAINYSTTIHGPGASNLELYTDSSRALFFYAFAPATLDVDGLTFENTTYDFTGQPSAVGLSIAGNCVGQEASIDLTDVTIEKSRSFNAGGAIFSDGCDLSLLRTTMTGNTTKVSGLVNGPRDGGAIKVIDTPGGGVADRLSIVDSTLSGNSAVARGGAVSTTNGARPNVLIRNSTISGNQSGDDGGGLYFGTVGDVTIERSTISGNRSTGEGAGLYFGYGDELLVDSSTFSGNQTGSRGGGIFAFANAEPLTVRNSTIAANSGNGGGGIAGINYYDKPASILNSTIVGNTGGGILRYAFDGAGQPIFSGPDEMTISSSIVANSAAAGDLATQSPTPSGSFKVDHSIIGSTGGTSVVETVPGSNRLNSGAVTLGPLADNGGPTQTMLPAAGSPALDAGVANGLIKDQRGSTRTVDAAAPNGAGDGTDIGAAEQADVSLQGGSVDAKGVQKLRGGKVAIAVEVGSAEAAHVDAGGEVSIGKGSVPLADAEADVAAGQSTTLELSPSSRKAKRKILKALGKGKRAKAAVEVTLTDQVGNSETESESVRLKVKRKHRKK